MRNLRLGTKAWLVAGAGGGNDNAIYFDVFPPLANLILFTQLIRDVSGRTKGGERENDTPKVNAQNTAIPTNIFPVSECIMNIQTRYENFIVFVIFFATKNATPNLAISSNLPPFILFW